MTSPPRFRLASSSAPAPSPEAERRPVAELSLATGALSPSGTQLSLSGAPWSTRYALGDGDVLLLARSRDVLPAVPYGAPEHRWAHVATVFRDERGRLLALDADPETDAPRVRPAEHLLERDGWEVAGWAPWHSRPGPGYGDALRRVARAREARGGRFGGPSAARGARVVLAALRAASHESAGTVPTPERRIWELAQLERIREPLDVAVGSTFLEYPNVVARLVV